MTCTCCFERWVAQLSNQLEGSIVILSRNRRRRRIGLQVAASVRSAPIDPFEQERQLCSTQQHRPTRGLRPDEVAFIEPAVIQTQSLRLVPQDLQPIGQTPRIGHTK
jgi:hypothetical protein